MSEVIEAPAVAPVAEPAPTAAAPAAAPSLLATGNAPAPEPSKIPEKYVVKRDDGTVDHEATALKVAEGYTHLERRLGAGDAPPKTPEDYAPAVTVPMDMAALKADPKYQGFLKGAHARGMTNAQLGYVLEHYASSVKPDPVAAEADLRKDWVSDDQFQRGLSQAYRAAVRFAGSPELQARLESKFGSDPDFIRLMARVGSSMGEDRPPQQALSAAESDTLAALMAHPAYFDSKHPEHSIIVRKATELYGRKFGG
jgi:hypothetical protein